MKESVKYFFCAALMLLAVCACSRLGGDRVDIDRLVGTWDEYYDDPAFVMDGSVTWNILPDEIRMHVYDALSNESRDWFIGYSVEREGGKYVISLDYPEEWYYQADESFEIVRLTDREMAWQKVGTTFSRGSYSSNYLHFVTDRYWAEKYR